MIKHLILTLSLLAAISTAQAPSTSPTGSRPTTVSLFPDHRPKAVLSEYTMTSSGKMALKVGDKAIDVPLDAKSSDKWVDEYLTPRNVAIVKGRRIYIESETSEGLIYSDSGLAGVSIVYTFGADGPSTLIDNGRVLPKRTLDHLANAGQFFATDVSRTITAAVGTKVEVSVEPIIRTLFGCEGTIRNIKSTFDFSSINARSNTAILLGAATWDEDVDVGPSIKAQGTYSFKLEIEIDLATRLMSKVELKGNMVASGRGESAGAVSGEIKIDGKFVARIVNDVKALIPAIPKFRENTHQVHGMEFRLSSAWVQLKVDDFMKTKFVDSRDSSGNLVIELVQRTDYFDLASDEAVLAFERSLKKKDPEAKAKKSTTPLGPAIAFELAAGPRDAIHGLVVSPSGKNIVIIRVTGSSDSVNKASREFNAMAASLKRE